MNEVFALEEKLNSNAIYPCTLVMDRYGGTYSGSKWLAFNCDPIDVPQPVGGSDTEEMEFWEVARYDDDYIPSCYNMDMGSGNTPNEAVLDLESNVGKWKERMEERERTIGRDTYIVHYFYGGQGNVTWEDVAEVECDSAKEAIDKYIEYDNHKHPKRIEHEDFHRGCLTAFKKSKRPKGVSSKPRWENNNKDIIKL